MRDEIRKNRRVAQPRDPEVISLIGNMWYNPKLPDDYDAKAAAKQKAGLLRHGHLLRCRSKVETGRLFQALTEHYVKKAEKHCSAADSCSKERYLNHTYRVKRMNSTEQQPSGFTKAIKFSAHGTVVNNVASCSSAGLSYSPQVFTDQRGRRSARVCKHAQKPVAGLPLQNPKGELVFQNLVCGSNQTFKGTAASCPLPAGTAQHTRFEICPPSTTSEELSQHCFGSHQTHLEDLCGVNLAGAADGAGSCNKRRRKPTPKAAEARECEQLLRMVLRRDARPKRSTDFARRHQPVPAQVCENNMMHDVQHANTLRSPAALSAISPHVKIIVRRHMSVADVCKSGVAN